MKFTNSIDNLVVYRGLTYLPFDKKDKYKGYMIILNNPSLADNVKFMNGHPKMQNMNAYQQYYMDWKFNERIGVKKIVLNKKQGRDEIYSTVMSDVPMIKRAPLRFEMLKDRNTFYDIQSYNDLYFKHQRKQLPPKDAMEAYFKFMISKINQPRFFKYKKMMVMDIQAWDMKATILQSPIIYMLISFRKYFDIFKAIGDIDIILYTDDFFFKLNPSKCSPKDFSRFKMALSKVTKVATYNDDYLDSIFTMDSTASNTADQLIGVFNFTGNLNQEILDDIELSVKTMSKVLLDEDRVDIIKRNEEIQQKAKTDRTASQDNKLPEEDNSIDELNLTSEQEPESEEEDIEIVPDNEEILDADELGELEEEQIDQDAKELADELVNNETAMADLALIVKARTTGKTTANMARDMAIRKKQRELKFKGITVADIGDIAKRTAPLEAKQLVGKVNTINKNMQSLKYINFEKTYNEKLFAQDTLKVLTNLNNMTVPTYVIDMKVEDSSDELNFKETYRITLEDENRVRHSITVDMPKFIDDKFLYINGTKKTINKQLTMKPIVKTGPDAVQVVSNYNKIFIRRVGQKLNSEIERLRSVLADKQYGITAILGNNSKANRPYLTTLEYDELASTYSSISNRLLNTEFIFNQEVIRDQVAWDTSEMPPNTFPIGVIKGKAVVCDTNTGFVEGKPLVTYISEALGEDFFTKYNEVKKFSKKFMYSEATLMSKNIPVIVILSYMEGLTTVIEKANIKYTLDEKNIYDPEKQSSVRFMDGYLIYDKYPLENQLLMNGLSAIPTASLSFLDMDDKETYLDIFRDIYGAGGLANALINFYEFMIDPITKEVLEDLDYPTDLVSVMIVASSLLADNKYVLENNMGLYRVRSNEIVNGILHEKLARAYSAYRATATHKRPMKISIPKDAIIKELMALNTVETHSTLNPIYEAEKVRAISAKGYRGMNLDRAYTQDKRSYDNSMIGILGMSTSPDMNVGVVRQLTMEPNIVSARGYLNVQDDNLDSVKDVNLFTPAELLSPLGASRDDSIRTAMASKQSKHIVPIDKSSPVLVSNGAEKVIQYGLSRDFVVVAKDNGKVIEVDEAAGIMVIEYNNGTHEAIDLNVRTVKNAQSGMYLPNQLQTKLKLGDKVKKDDIIATESKFFTDSIMEGNRMNIGSLQKVAVASSYATIEDSCFVTNKMATEMAADIILADEAIIGSNADIVQMAKIGDHVEVGDPLITYTESYKDDTYNKLLAKLSDDLAGELTSLSRTPIKAKNPGEIVDIKIYCTVELDELSESTKKIVSAYYNSIKKRKKVLDKYDKTPGVFKAGMLLDEPTSKITPGADGTIKGRKVFDGVLIEFYIQHKNPLGVGDKLIYFTALKSICGEVIPEGYEPYSLDRPDEEISTFIGPSAILARKTPSVLLTMYTNKVLVELKEKLRDIYNSK